MTKRHIVSWLLLAVFVPMLLVSSLHLHEGSEVSGASCVECVQHHCHGHLTQLTDTIHECVQCQFLTLTFVAAATVAAAIVYNVLRFRYALLPSAVYSVGQGVTVTRGPPFM